MTVSLKIVPQIKSKLNTQLMQSKVVYVLNWPANTVTIENVVGIYGVEGIEDLTKFRFKTQLGTDEIIIANANFTIWAIE